MGIALPPTQTNRGLNLAGLAGVHNYLDNEGYGDNIHDDSVVLNALFARVTASPTAGCTVVLPTATYLLLSMVTVPSRCTLWILNNVVFTGPGYPTTSGSGVIIDWRVASGGPGPVGPPGPQGPAGPAGPMGPQGQPLGLTDYEAAAQSGTTITLPATPAGVLHVAINGQILMRTRDWTIAGPVITLTTALSSDDVHVEYWT